MRKSRVSHQSGRQSYRWRLCLSIPLLGSNSFIRGLILLTCVWTNRPNIAGIEPIVILNVAIGDAPDPQSRFWGLRVIVIHRSYLRIALFKAKVVCPDRGSGHVGLRLAHIPQDIICILCGRFINHDVEA